METEVPDMETIESEVQILTPGALAAQTSSEISQMVATAKQWPRKLDLVKKNAYHLITNNADIAASCSFAMPRDGKVVTGPSIRFAEIIFGCYQNCRAKSRTVDEGEDYITAEGMFFDVQNNTAVSCEVKMRIVDREGRRYSHDMIVNTSNAAGAKAFRNAVLRGIPKAWWLWLYEEAQKVIAGDVKTLSERRDKAIDLFKAFGMTPAMICRVVGVETVSEMTVDHLATLQAILNALQEKETTVEQLMENTQDRGVAEKGQRTIDQIKVKYEKDAAARAQAKLEAKRKQAKAAAAEPVKVADIKVEPVKEEPPF